ncbi:MAG: ImmA/IrrE family metallo-endopeptidase [Eubacterium sp.]|nr:ImmA/IrrE family metallo-endopeptidase [Eubacterium sp.]
MKLKHGKLSDEIYEYIKEEACFLLEKYDVRCMPISGFEIAIKMEIIIVPYSSLSEKKQKWALEISEDGFYYEDNEKCFGQEFIYYNDIDKSYARQNMTILHEIGHCVLDHTGENPNQEEIEAKFFAKYIIAPPVLVDKINPEWPDEIMNFFDVSPEAAGYAFEYYQNWKRFHYAYGDYTPYERRLLRLYNKYSA